MHNYLILIFFNHFAGPKRNTIADFWLMIWQENIEEVVMLTNLMEGTKVIMHYAFILLMDFIDSIFYIVVYECICRIYFTVEMRPILAKSTNIYGVR